MPENKLEVDSILHNYGYRQLLTNIYLSCKTGEIVGLLGRNGCGKTTLLKIIFGTLPTLNKHIRINGNVYSEPYKSEGLLAYLPQHDFLPANIKLHKIIDLYHKEQDIRETIKQDERIQHHLTKYAGELSKGELRYFELMLLLEKDVKFLLLDEPFSGIAPLYVEYIEELLQAHLGTKGFLITDHDYQSVLRVSDRIILLADGYARPIHGMEELYQWGYIPANALK
ncbi:ATP-binding cassette domain-containing protein [Pontibacter sp. BT310]|uniref:ATP-binding cassette domain-containing protein n=1 Tax=Pontibacter populi TaxID=890055 RepID=A0ABS6X7L4_9BACT|nr:MULTISPECIES: ATP-binding cassette domain-containing protein [Pontibacter]MBJ6117129.1 ATP-binding cassette domain-containing protein [Pontibacter sp. BT310]MBR0569553.1 ATP-binding cassette domain-containing protein [Microvirga sp. STS03]MBW3363982.1 ATP-binding cassette domain-containing protein [Pontibacter populi]